MKFSDFLKRDAGPEWGAAPASTVTRVERELASGKRLSHLVEERAQLFDGLPVEHLRELTESYRRYEVWRARAVEAGRRLERIELEVISRTTRPHQLALIERARKLCEAARVEARDRPAVVSAALELWDAARSDVRRRGRVRCRAARADHPALDQYGDYVGRTEDIDALRPHRWLAMRRGERDGALELEVDASDIGLVALAAARRERFGLAARDRTDESLLQELVLDDLRHAVTSDLDVWARSEALRFACDAYAGLLRCRPLKAPRVGAVYLGAPHEPIGVAVLDQDGRLVEGLELDPERQGWLTQAMDLLGGAEVRHLVVPSDTRSSKRLSTLEERLVPGVSVTSVRPAALAEGRHALRGAERELSRAVASALVLGRRAMDPLGSWAAIDPVKAGVGEYQADIAEDDLREALTATRALVRMRSAAAPPPPVTSVTPAARPLGPIVRSAAELRAGMTVTGQVTNVTAFGAFVALNLEYEGMIHVSELSDGFVQNPTEVVQIGQHVTARVVAVDPQRRRISLSLRTQTERDRRTPLPRRGPQRSQALRDLEKLFKKG